MKAINYIVIFLMMSILVKNFTKINKHISFHNHVERLFSKENKKEKVILTSVIEESNSDESFIDNMITVDFKFNLIQIIHSNLFSDLFSTSTNKICLLRRYIYGLPFT